jgi:PhzF family phenazine biosynthesis protein
MSAEDPATGSAAGPLSAYLFEHGDLELVDGKAWIEVTQGLQVGRECVIRVALSFENSEDEVPQHVDLVGGAVVVAEGKIAIPDTSTPF